MNIDAFRMETDDNNEEQIEDPLSMEEQPPTIDDIHLDGINEVLIRNSIILKCRLSKTDDVETSEFKILNDLLPDLLEINRTILREKVLAKISSDQMGEGLYHDIFNWLLNEGSILIVKFLPYLSLACEMKFHECTIENYEDRRVFVPIEGNHEISTAIYYICDSSRQTIKGIFITDRAYINRIHNLLLQTPNQPKDIIQLYKKLISEYIKQAENLPFHQHLLLLSKWQDIYKCYKAMERLEHRLSSIEKLDYSRCLIMLSKYSAAEEQTKSLLSDLMVKTDEAWYLRAIAQRKRKQYKTIGKERIDYENYSKARSSITAAVNVNRASEKILNEKIIIDNLQERISPREATLEYTINHRRRNDNCPSYNILSIDGGGIRGIMAAIWLRELERRTQRTCSSMFQMMAGTSTGAIIAAGLSLPKTDNSMEPKYFASNLVDLYKTKGEQIFVKKSRIFCNYRNYKFSLAPKYSSDGRQRLFTEYFRDTRLHECLTDIVIPVVKTGDTYTHLYTKNDSLYSTCLIDVLMATTAAPTYFKPHYWNDTNNIDGGVQMNNPTLAAYTKAIEYRHNKENLYVLSLGTGDYIKDPLTANPHPDFFHYVRHHKTLAKVLLDSQQHNVDYQMSSLMDDEHYYRWQVWFEDEIELDDYKEDTVNKLENIAYEYWEEMEVHDKNRLNKLIDHLKQE